MSKERLTFKQTHLLTIIAKGNKEDGTIDLDEILESLQYETSKQSLQFSIRALVVHQFIEKKGLQKRRGRMRQVIEATELGKKMIGAATAPVSTPAYIETEEEIVIEGLLGE